MVPLDLEEQPGAGGADQQREEQMDAVIGQHGPRLDGQQRGVLEAVEERGAQRRRSVKG